MDPPSTCRVQLRISYSIIGTLVGLSVLLVFGIQFGNWNAALWGMTSGIFAAVTLVVHVCYIKEVWQSYTYMLKRFMLTGCFVQLAGICGFVTYLTLGIVQHQGLIIEGPGYFLTCVWCFMTWKWGFFLFYFSRTYRWIYEGLQSVEKGTSATDGRYYS